MISPCILLIDDDTKLLIKMEAVLQRAGYRVLTANDGRQGVYLAQAASPEVIVCDTTMPSPDGFAIQGILAEDPGTSSIPFLFMTNRKTRMGAGNSISKPFDTAELVARVNEIIRYQPVR